MNKYLEYIKLLPKGLANIDKVFEGIVNETKLKYKTLSEDQQAEIIRRRVICQACPLNSINALESKEYKDYYLEKDSTYVGFNEFTGYKFFKYTLIRLN